MTPEMDGPEPTLVDRAANDGFEPNVPNALNAGCGLYKQGLCPKSAMGVSSGAVQIRF